VGVGSGLYMYDVVVKRSRSLSHLLMSSCSVMTAYHQLARACQNVTKYEVSSIIHSYKNSSGDEIVNVNFFTTILHTYFV